MQENNDQENQKLNETVNDAEKNANVTIETVAPAIVSEITPAAEPELPVAENAVGPSEVETAPNDGPVECSCECSCVSPDAPSGPPVKMIGIRFKTMGEFYYIPDEVPDLKVKDCIIVKLAKGKDIAEVAVLEPPSCARISDPQMHVLRKANETDLLQEARNREREKEAFGICLGKIKKLEMPMKLLAVKYMFDGSRVTFYFKADSKVDFRKLVRELAFVFRTRIELRQVGPRDETEIFGGLGICGREVCCKYWNCRAKAVLSVDTQKTPFLNIQGLQNKAMGLCSRPLCCLRYEGDAEPCKITVPPVNSKIIIDDQKGILKVADENSNLATVAIDGESVDINLSYEDFLLKLQEGKIKVVRESQGLRAGRQEQREARIEAARAEIRNETPALPEKKSELRPQEPRQGGPRREERGDNRGQGHRSGDGRNDGRQQRHGGGGNRNDRRPQGGPKPEGKSDNRRNDNKNNDNRGNDGRRGGNSGRPDNRQPRDGGGRQRQDDGRRNPNPPDAGKNPNKPPQDDGTKK